MAQTIINATYEDNRGERAKLVSVQSGYQSHYLTFELASGKREVLAGSTALTVDALGLKLVGVV